MREYKVRVIETLEREVIIEANSKDEAVGIVQRMYDQEEIVLDAEDFAGMDIK